MLDDLIGRTSVYQKLLICDGVVEDQKSARAAEGTADAATNAPGLAVSQKLTVLGVGTLPGLLDPLAVVVTDERGGGLL